MKKISKYLIAILIAFSVVGSVANAAKPVVWSGATDPEACKSFMSNAVSALKGGSDHETAFDLMNKAFAVCTQKQSCLSVPKYEQDGLPFSIYTDRSKDIVCYQQGFKIIRNNKITGCTAIPECMVLSDGEIIYSSVDDIVVNLSPATRQPVFTAENREAPAGVTVGPEDGETDVSFFVDWKSTIGLENIKIDVYRNGTKLTKHEVPSSKLLEGIYNDSFLLPPGSYKMIVTGKTSGDPNAEVAHVGDDFTTTWTKGIPAKTYTSNTITFTVLPVPKVELNLLSPVAQTYTIAANESSLHLLYGVDWKLPSIKTLTFHLSGTVVENWPATLNAEQRAKSAYFKWYKNLKPGTYQLLAEATTESGLAISSKPVAFKVTKRRAGELPSISNYLPSALNQALYGSLIPPKPTLPTADVTPPPVVDNPSNPYPTCSGANADPDGDGWGWENNRSCQVSGSSNPDQSPTSSNKDRNAPVFGSSSGVVTYNSQNQPRIRLNISACDNVGVQSIRPTRSSANCFHNAAANGCGSCVIEDSITHFSSGTKMSYEARDKAGNSNTLTLTVGNWSIAQPSSGSVMPLSSATAVVIVPDASTARTTTPPPTTEKPSFAIAASANTGGTVSKSPNQVSATLGTSVTLTATPKAGYRFTKWQLTHGDNQSTPTTNPLTLTLKAKLSAVANFEKIPVTPTITTQTTLTNEYLTVSGCGNDELVSSFTLSNGETLAHCLRSGEVKVGDLVVAKSALSTSGCSQYGTDYRSTSVAWNEGRLYLCRQMKAAASGLTVINRSTIRVGACPSGYQSSSSAVQKNTTYHHCVKTGTLSFETSAGGKESWLAGVWKAIWSK